MSIPAMTQSFTMYHGEQQPTPEERLEQIKIFLADEDYHRNLNFTHKLHEIEKYIEFLEHNHYNKANGDRESSLLTYVKEMIHIHIAWIKKATGVPSLSFNTGHFRHQNRIVHMIKNPETREEIIHKRAPKLSRELALSSAPALHKVIDEKDGQLNPDPFLYTKKVGEVRRRQNTITAGLQVSSSAANFNGPYTLLSSERRTAANGDQAQTDKQVSVMRDFNGRVNAEVLSIIDIAQPLDPETELTEIGAARLLQKQILTEHNHNWGDKTPNFSKLWSFANGMQSPQTFFALDRWPLELQSPEQRDKIRHKGPKPYPREKISPQDRKLQKNTKRVALDPNERYIPGETFFPFGETEIQAERKSQMIHGLLSSAPEFAHLHAPDEKGMGNVRNPTPRVDLLALPQLSEKQHDNAEAFQELASEGEGQISHRSFGKRTRSC